MTIDTNMSSENTGCRSGSVLLAQEHGDATGQRKGIRQLHVGVSTEANNDRANQKGQRKQPRRDPRPGRG